MAVAVLFALFFQTFGAKSLNWYHYSDNTACDGGNFNGFLYPLSNGCRAGTYYNQTLEQFVPRTKWSLQVLECNEANKQCIIRQWDDTATNCGNTNLGACCSGVGTNVTMVTETCVVLGGDSQHFVYGE